MSSRYLESIRNPQPYPASDSESIASRSRTPVSVGPKNYSTPGRTTPNYTNPPSRSRTPASVLELINPKPYPNAQQPQAQQQPRQHHAYDNPVLKPTAVKGGPDNTVYLGEENTNPRSKRLTKTKSTPRGAPGGSDAELKISAQQPSLPTNGFTGGSVSSLDLALQIADGEPIKKESAFDVEAGAPKPAPRTTSIEGKYKPDDNHKYASVALGSKPIDTTKSSHSMGSSVGKRERIAKAGGRDEKDWDEDDDEDEVWYKRHEKLLWLVFFLVVIFFALGLGLGLRSAGSGTSPGIFAGALGTPCRYSCRNRAKYTNRGSNPLIVFAIDGMTSDVLQDSDATKNIRRLSECGARSHEMVPAFASTTYPNLWTFLTGQYPESHGVFSDFIRSTTRSSRTFEPRVTQEYLDEPEWYRAKPLWQTAREQGVITASHSWVGNNMLTYENDVTQTVDSKPNYFQRYNSLLSAQDMIDTVMEWITQDNVELIPQFISVFFNEPGDTIRQYGHNTEQAKAAMMEVDMAIGSLMDYLASRQDGNCFNIMLLSPSVVVNTTCGNNNNNVRFLNQEVPNTLGYETTPSYINTLARIQINSFVASDERNTNEELAAYLKCRISEDGSVFTRADLPSRHHYSSDMMPDDVYVLMDEGKSFAMNSASYSQQSCQYASDGYDPNDINSKAMFIGFGTNFRINHRGSEFNTMDVYNLMTNLLGVTGEPNNGTDGALNSMLRSPGAFPAMQMEFAVESTCPYSTLDMALYETGCTCPPVSEGGPTAMERGEEVFNTNSNSAERHIPFGAPELLASANPDSGASCKLYQTSYVMAYDKTLSISKYVSLTLSPGFNTVTMPPGCILTDTRLAIGESPTCAAYGPEESLSLAPDIQMSFLLQPELSVGEADAGVISSNIIPIHPLFEIDIWDQLIGQYRAWSNLVSSSQGINIVQGPIYDLNRDGVADPLPLIASSNAWAGQTVVPSHFFIIATRCANNTALDSCQPHQVEALAFILPHNNMGMPCQQTTMMDYLMEYRASVMDVERMSGLCFFPEWSVSVNDNVRRTITLMKSNVASTMWTN